MDNKGQLGFIRVLFIALAFILIFSIGLAGFVSESTEVFANQWGDEYPMLAWLINGMNVWIFVGAIIAIIAGIVWGLSLTGD